LIHNLDSILNLAISHRSNLFSSKNVTSNNSSTLSSVARSPGLNNLYKICKASNLFVVLSFSNVGAIWFAIISSHNHEKVSNISALDSSQNALNNIEIGSFLFLSIFTFIIHFFSISISNHEPLAGINLRE
jgi:hypothetical protein